MRYICLLMVFTFSIKVCSQEYEFLPKSLHLVSIENMERPKKPIELTYTESGELIEFRDAMKKVASEKVIPKMYADSTGEYKALIISNTIEIDYPGIPDNLKKLGYSFGNTASDTILIFSQGGPSLSLNNWKWQKSVLRLNKEFGNYFFVNARQTQMIDAERYKTTELSFSEAKAYNEKSTEIVFNLVKYFKSQNKKVFLYGASGGAFLITDLLATYGNVADGYLVMVGRLDMNDEMWKSRLDGVRMRFNKDGKTLYEGEMPTSIHGRNNEILKSAGSYKRYTELLKQVDLSNMIYLYGKTDDRVGSLLDHEIDFLKSRNAMVVASEGDHSCYLNYLEILLRLLLLE